MKKYLIILGPPGSGKGTQAKMLASELQFFYFGTGDLMRQEAVALTPLGIQFKEAFQKGELVSDSLVDQFVKEKITQIKGQKGLILDGYPRTLVQTESLEKIITDWQDNALVININVPKEDLIKRLSTRRICSKCKKIFLEPVKQGITECDACGGALIQRADDKDEVIEKRIDVYEAQTKPLIDYYQKKGILLDVDGRPSVEEVKLNITRALNEY